MSATSEQAPRSEWSEGSAGSAGSGHDRLIFLHGFTQTHHHWHRVAHLIAGRLATPPTSAFVDLPGHGLSGDDRTAIASSGPALADLAGRGTYVGYSMGGRFGLVAALARPESIERLVLVGATPGIEADSEREHRVASDAVLASRIERVGVAEFLDEWLALPLFAGLCADDSGLDHRLRNTAVGLASSLRESGTGSQGSLWSRLGEITSPVLVLAGEHDKKFTAIARRLADTVVNGSFISVPNAGHAAHTEQPGATAEIIASWLRTTPVSF